MFKKEEEGEELEGKMMCKEIEGQRGISGGVNRTKKQRCREGENWRNRGCLRRRRRRKLERTMMFKKENIEGQREHGKRNKSKRQ